MFFHIFAFIIRQGSVGIFLCETSILASFFSIEASSDKSAMVLSIEAVLSRCCGHPHWFLQTASDGIAYSCVSHHSIEFVGIVIAHKAHHFSLVKVEKTFSCHDHRRSAKHRPYGSLVMRCLFLQNHRVGSKGYDSVIMFSKRSPAKSTTLFHQNMTALELEINKRSLTKCISCGQSFLRHLFCQYKAGFF